MAAKAGTLKILIADKDREFIASLADRFYALNDIVCQLDVGESGDWLLDKVCCQPFDLVFLGMNLKDMDGLDALAKIGHTNLPLPIIMIGGNNNARIAVEAMKRGVLDFLLKDDVLTADLSSLLQRLHETAALRQENAELRQINKMKDDFLATISHELKTPLTSIVGHTDVLLSGRVGPLEDKQRKSMKRILEQSQNLSKIIGQLLDIQMLLGDKAEMEMEPLSFREMLTNQVGASDELFQKKGVKLKTQLEKGTFNILANSEGLSKVVEHLISNALKFTPREGLITISLKKRNTRQLEVSVQDTGRGIPPEALPHVFQRFYHVDQSLTRSYGGMGLGLAFCKEMIEALGGRIWVESDGVDKGTTVSFLLPLKKEKTPPAAVPEVDGKKVVLWVDDNPSLLGLVEYGFSGFSHPIKLLTAHSGVAALAKVEQVVPHLIVLDIMMSDMDGFEVLQRLRRNPKTEKVSILVVSGYEKEARNAINRGADDYFLKPFRLQDLLKKVEGILYPPA